MVKIISIKDETYKRLLSMKRNLGNISFSETIETLLSFYLTRKEKTDLKSLTGNLKESEINKSRLRRLMNG
jgi:predicted CopG family antitoxin